MSDLPIALAPDEQLLWSGAPRHGVVFRGSDALGIPFTLVFLTFALLLNAGLWTSGAPWFVRVLASPFVLAGAYTTFGRFWTDAWVRANTRYFVTTRNIVIATDLLRPRTRLIQLRTLTNVVLDLATDGSGTITFGKLSYSPLAPGSIAGSGIERLPSFEMIPDAKRVYSILDAAQHQAAVDLPAPAPAPAPRRVS